MQYRKLGKTRLNVSLIGFGASPLGNEFGEIEEKEGERAVHFAIDQGINFFDVSPYYGLKLAETRLGKFLYGKRKKIYLATKMGRYGSSIPQDFDYSASRVRSSLEESLKRLQTDYIDVFQVHDIEFGRQEQIINETIPAMLKLKEEGKVRFVGITSYALELLKKVAELCEIDTILSYCRYNLLDTTLDQVLTPLARQKNIGLINASPLHMRVLTDKGAPPWHPAPKKVAETAAKAALFCREQGIDIADLALKFALSHDFVDTTLVGMSKVRHVRSNVAVLEKEFDPEILQKVREMIKPETNVVWQEGRPENFEPGAVLKNH